MPNFFINDDDLDLLQRRLGTGEVFFHETRSDPNAGLRLNLTRNCPCDRCWKRHQCVRECGVFTGWVNAAGKGRRLTAEVSATG